MGAQDAGDVCMLQNFQVVYTRANVPEVSGALYKSIDPCGKDVNFNLVSI